MTLVALALALALAALTGCADFPDQSSGPWQSKPPPRAIDEPEPQIPGRPESGRSPGDAGPPASRADAEPEGCNDPDPMVVATCLNPVGGIAVLPGGDAALVTERTTGRVLRVAHDTEPVEVASIPVQASADGGLTGIALSPTYREDQLFFVYATTKQDNRVLRVAAGEEPKPVLTGIPKGKRGNAGAMSPGRPGALLVATGDAGSQQDASSLGGKVLRINAFGKPAEGNPKPGNRIISSGTHSPGGICRDRDRSENGESGIWLTDRAQRSEALYRLRPGQPLSEPSWNWPGRPGIGGCAVTGDSVVVPQRDRQSALALNLGPRRTSFTGQPVTVLEEAYGQIAPAALGPNGLLWLGTVNTDTDRPRPAPPVSSDDRVIRIEPPSQGGGGSD